MSQNACPSYPDPVRPLAGIARPSFRAPDCRTWNIPKRSACCSRGSPSISTSARSQNSSRYSRCRRTRSSQPVCLASASACRDLVAERRHRPSRRPAVGDELDQTQRRAGLDLGREGRAREVRLGLGGRLQVVRALDHVVVTRGHPQLARLRPVDEDRAQVVRAVALGLEGALQHRAARVGSRKLVELHVERTSLVARHRLVGHQFRLEDHPQRLVDRLDDVLDRRDRPLRERHQPGRVELDRVLGGRGPLDLPGQGPGAQVERALVACRGARSAGRTARRRPAA